MFSQSERLRSRRSAEKYREKGQPHAADPVITYHYLGGFCGSETINTVGGDCTDIVPPCDAMMARTLESPRPVPWCFVVKRGSNIFCIFSSAMPSPESSNSKTRWFFS